jgi:hypothetical protein
MIQSDERLHRPRFAPSQVLAALAGWLAAAVLLGPAARRMQAKLTRLSQEMGLRSAEVIAFPQSRRRHPSPLLKLSQRADAKPRQPKPRPDARSAPRVDRG